jgi:hypothetical protein
VLPTNSRQDGRTNYRGYITPGRKHFFIRQKTELGKKLGFVTKMRDQSGATQGGLVSGRPAAAFAGDSRRSSESLWWIPVAPSTVVPKRPAAAWMGKVEPCGLNLRWGRRVRWVGVEESRGRRSRSGAREERLARAFLREISVNSGVWSFDDSRLIQFHLLRHANWLREINAWLSVRLLIHSAAQIFTYNKRKMFTGSMVHHLFWD